MSYKDFQHKVYSYLIKFNIEEDAIAQQYVQNAFPDCNISQIEMAEEIAKEGGALHCLSWNVYLPKSHVKT